MTLINTGGTTLSGATTSITSIPGTYKYLYGVIVNWLPATDNVHLRWRFNGDSTANRYKYDSGLLNFANEAFNDTGLYLGQQSDNGTSQSISVFYVYDYANTTSWKMAIGYTAVNNPTTSSNINFMATVGLYNQTGAITEINFFPGSGNFTSGTVYLYGVK